MPWLASIATLHRIADVADPTRSEDVKAARRAVTRNRNAPEQKAPLHWADVEKAIRALGGRPRDLRAKALISIAYSTLGRRTELIALRVEDITLSPEGDGSVTLKTKGGDRQERYLAPEARVALQRWLNETQIKEGYDRRRMEKSADDDTLCSQVVCASGRDAALDEDGAQSSGIVTL